MLTCSGEANTIETVISLKTAIQQNSSRTVGGREDMYQIQILSYFVTPMQLSVNLFQ